MECNELGSQITIPRHCSGFRDSNLFPINYRGSLKINLNNNLTDNFGNENIQAKKKKKKS